MGSADSADAHDGVKYATDDGENVSSQSDLRLSSCTTTSRISNGAWLNGLGCRRNRGATTFGLIDRSVNSPPALLGVICLSISPVGAPDAAVADYDVDRPLTTSMASASARPASRDWPIT
jgi:hypothetical protein